MRSATSTISPAHHIIERQMRNWELAQAQRVASPIIKREIYPYVAVSRHVASGGRQIARAVAEQLGWSCFDRELIDIMASDDDVRRRLYAIEDENERGIFQDILLSIGYQGQRNDYFHRLCEASIRVATRQPAVFVGRGVGFILPAKSGVSVRIVASDEYCDARLATRDNVPVEVAQRQRRRLEDDRRKFLLKHFGRRVESLAAYDLTLSVERIGQSEAARLITSLVKYRFRDYFGGEQADAVRDG